jgi:DNA-binding NtrC family response regulator
MQQLGILARLAYTCAARVKMQTILVVDDDPQLRNFITRQLADAGYRVLEARSAEEAQILANLNQREIHLLLVEKRLSGQNGIEVAASTAGLHPEVRVVIVSNHPEDAISKAGFGAGYSSFLQKPFTQKTLIDKVEQALSGPSWLG